MNAMLRLATVSALALTAATGAVAQEPRTVDTAKTTTADPMTSTATTTESRTTTRPSIDSTGTAVTQKETKTKTKTKASGSATEPAGTSTTTATDAATAAPMTGTDAATPPAANAPTVAAPTANAPAAAAPAGAPAGTVPAAASTTAATTPNPTVGGVAMAATNNVVQNASAAPNLSTLVGLVTAADLTATLSGPGPFTVFAPTNEAFGRVAQVTRDALAKPEAKPQLQRVLKYHVVPGALTFADLKAKAAAGGTLTTVEGQTLTVKALAANGGETLELTDANGNKSYVETPDVRQSNGIVHVVNGVLFPKLS